MIPINVDTHIHTNFSPDADENATFEAYISQAKKIGLSKIIFTDHVDFDAAHPLFKTPIDYDIYMEKYQEVLQKTKNIELGLGVEIGYQPHVVSEMKSFLKKYPFEHVILSIHYIDKKDLYTKEFFEGKSKKEAYTIYFDTLLKAVTEMDEFTVVGHLDYISRYSGMGDYEYDDYKNIIDQILQVIIQKNKGIEINTSGFKHEGRQYPKKEVINRFIELGGTKITIGSDSHRISELATRFSDFI